MSLKSFRVQYRRFVKKKTVEEEFKTVYNAFKEKVAAIECKATEVEETWNKFVETSSS